MMWRGEGQGVRQLLPLSVTCFDPRAIQSKRDVGYIDRNKLGPIAHFH